jgi:hypothetical protein
MLGIAVAQAGLLPSEISSLGIKFGASSQSVLLLLLGLICLYYLAAFLVYAASDYVAWKIALRDAIHSVWFRPREKIEEPETEEDVCRAIRRDESFEEFMQKHNTSVFLAEIALLPVSRARALFEFLLPAAVGTYATVVLFAHSAA